MVAERPREILADDRWARPSRREVLGIRRFATEVLGRLSGWEPVSHRVPLLHPLEPLWLSAETARRKPGVYYSPGFNPPLLSRSPLVFTIHDLIHLRFGPESGLRQRAFYELVVRPAARRAAAVLTVSAFSKEQIADWASLEPERVIVVGAGASAAFRVEGPRHDPGYRYVLYAGNLKPHKNVPRLVEAFALARFDDRVRLVVVGPPSDELALTAGALGVADRLVFAGRLDDEGLADYYRGATVVALPSLFEGFGLPALEAMASGVPLVAAAATSLPEIVGDAAILVDPTDTEEITEALTRAIEDEALRAVLRTRGLERARRFSWDDTASKVSAALKAARETVG